MANSKTVRSYFSHDSTARNSEKLIRVRMRHSAAGYGVYFMILERLREENNYMSVKDYNMIAFDLRVDASLVKSVVEEFGLFVFTEDGKYFYSEEFTRRMNIKDEETARRSEAGKKGMAQRYTREAEQNKAAPDGNSKNEKTNQLPQNDNNVITQLSISDNNVITQLPKSGNKKSKEKKVKESKYNTPPQTPPLPGGVCPSQKEEAEISFSNSAFKVRNADTLTAAARYFGATPDYIRDLLRMSNGGEKDSPVWSLFDSLKESGGRFGIVDVVRTMVQYEKSGAIRCKSAMRMRIEELIAQTVKPEEIPEILQALTFPEREQRCLQAIEEIRISNGKIRLPARYILAELQKVPAI